MTIRRRLGLVWMLCGVVLAAVWGCSVLVDFEECTTNEECQQSVGPASVCSSGICSASGPADGNLIGGPCQEIIGSGGKRDFYIGVLLPLTGEEGGFGRPLLNAIRIAQNDFNAIGGVRSRPISLLVCDTQGLDQVALEGAEHLASVGIQAMIGPDFSRQVLDVATQVTIQNQMVLVTPSGTAAPIRILEDQNLVWRTVANDAVQGRTLGLLVDRVVTRDLNLTWQEARVLVLVREADSYSAGLSEAVASVVPRDDTGQSLAEFRNYPEAWEEFWVANRGQIQEPDVVVILGASEAWDFAEEIDDFFPNQNLFIFADAAKNSEEASRTSMALEGRILGTAPQNVGETDYIPYQSFRVKYRSDYDEDPNQFQFVANAFDALFVIALGAAAEGVTGPQIAAGMARLSDTEAEDVSADQTGATRAIEILQNGGAVDYQGAAGPMNFDETGEPDFTPIALWCFTSGGVPEQGVLFAGVGLRLEPVSCEESTNNLNNTNNGPPDMGNPDAGNADMGSPDTGNADIGGD